MVTTIIYRLTPFRRPLENAERCGILEASAGPSYFKENTSFGAKCVSFEAYSESRYVIACSYPDSCAKLTVCMPMAASRRRRGADE